MLILARSNAAKHYSFHQILSPFVLGTGEESALVIGKNNRISIALLLEANRPGRRSLTSLRNYRMSCHLASQLNILCNCSIVLWPLQMSAAVILADTIKALTLSVDEHLGGLGVLRSLLSRSFI
jgi:hypothetical protein